MKNLQAYYPAGFPFCKVVLMIWMSFSIMGNLSAQEITYAYAQKLATSGDHDKAEEAFEQLLSETPDDLQLLIGQGFNYSWNGKYFEAKRVFSKILRMEPDQSDALSGMGYTLAWEGNYGKARSFFQMYLNKYPDSKEAEKGLAYTDLWAGNAQEAVIRFEALTTSYPENEELKISLGQAYLLTGRHKDARGAFEEALILDDENEDANELLQKMSVTPALIEANVWGGYSRIENAGEFGLRAARLSWRITHQYQVWARYDNALTLDNLSLTRSNQQFGAFFVGGLASWDKNWATRLEVGRRNLQGDLSQWFVQGEQVAYLKEGKALKVGGFFGPRSDGTHESMSYVGGVLPLMDGLTFEPTYFYSTSSASGSDEHRLLLASTYRFPKGIEVNGGIQYGRVVSEQTKGNIIGGHLIGYVPMGKHWIQLLARYESALNNPLLIGALGLRFRLEK